MLTVRYFLAILIVCIFSLSIASAQQENQTNPQSPAPVIVMVTASNERVRYASLGEVQQTRLQVFSPAGSQVFDSGFHLGNLVNWQTRDQQGQTLGAGSYLYLVTVKDFADRLTQKYGTVVLDGQQVYLEQTNRAELPQTQAAALEANQQTGVLSAVDRIGAGYNGIATVSTDGETVIDSAPPVIKKTSASQTNPGGENIAGTGTPNRVAKWVDGAGTLSDSSITEINGKVGIGITNPSYKLVVGPDIGAGLVAADLTISRGVGQSVSAFVGPSGARGMEFGWDEAGSRAFLNAPANTPISFLQGGPEKMRIDSAGNVGIGTTTPVTKLYVQTASENYGILHSNGVVEVGTWAGANYTGTQGGWIGTKTNHPLRLFAGLSGAAIAIETNGKVGIGTATPGAVIGGRLEVFGGNDVGVFSRSDSGTALYGFSVNHRGVYGLSTNDHGVDGYSDNSYGVYGSSEHSYAGYFDGPVKVTGSLTVTSCTGCTISSDQSLKANFASISPRSVLDRLAALPIKEWNYKSDQPTVRHVGPMAQDFRAAFNLGLDDKHIDMVDANGVTMAAIQGLYQMMLKKDRQIGQLQTEVRKLKRAIARRHTGRRPGR